MLVFDLDPEKLENVSHDACSARNESDYNFRLDDSIFGLRNSDSESDTAVGGPEKLETPIEALDRDFEFTFGQ